MRYLLDTNAVSDLLKRANGKIAQKVISMESGEIVISVIVSAEIEFGISASGSRKIRDAFDVLKARHPITAFEPETDAEYGRLRAKLKAAGTPIGPNDLFIAAHALALDAVLVTDNDKEFSRVPGLKVENWLR